ncbi:cytochrome c [Balneolaceae bacterium YR4-1]|uniref:Cytochrome c n=1 Tax=Halalkalibaculum roseum TaxID=2709311 RepID=A0A6M1T1X3_9BACT|nr:cytochrome c [Halalkalibaculum roseum]NGP77534.1 cytochrome c [Halalkalibaculum roseum]
MKNIVAHITGIIISGMLLLAGCGGSGNGGEQQNASAQESSGLTEFEQQHGVGPVNEVVEVGEINSEMVETGKEIFRTKCSACHKMDQGYVGPPLGDVLEKRTPTYVMNMILNPVEMTKKHPEARKMLQQYMNQMTFQNVSKEEARAIVEYLASVQSDKQNEQNN